MRRMLLLALVATGGAAGTLVRYAAGREWPMRTAAFPWTTLAVNVAGAFLLGVLLASMRRPRPRSLWRRPLLATGFLGGMTTFSTMAVEAVRLADHGRAGTAASYLAVSCAAGVTAAALGLKVAR